MADFPFEAWLDEVKAYVRGPAQIHATDIEQKGSVSEAIWTELRDRGFLRLTAPKEYGGYGLSFRDYLLLLEQFAQMHGSMRVIVHVMNSLWRSVAAKASPAQIDRFVRPLVSLDHRITFTLSEPNSGSGADIQTTARRDGDEYVVNGEKWMIIFSDVADYFLLFCRLEGTTGGDGTLALLVSRDAPGLSIDLMPAAMGIAGTAHGHLYLRDCRVPVDHRLGNEGDGLDVAFRGFLDPSRTAIGMTCVGAATRSLELSIDHATERITFGQPLVKRPTIQMWLAEMATDIEAARLLVLSAADRFDCGEPITSAAAMAKLFGTDMLQRVTDKALQIHGGIGYFRSSEMERLYRDARMQRFEEGTAEIQKMVIVRDVISRRARERSH